MIFTVEMYCIKTKRNILQVRLSKSQHLQYARRVIFYNAYTSPAKDRSPGVTSSAKMPIASPSTTTNSQSTYLNFSVPQFPT